MIRYTQIAMGCCADEGRSMALPHGNGGPVYHKNPGQTRSECKMMCYVEDPGMGKPDMPML